MTTELLRDIGSEAVLVPDGKAALAAVECDAAIDLVISDIVMPGGMSGIDLARQLRERRPELPILLATGYSQYAPQIVDEGFVLVEKPYSRGALVAAIRAAVEQATPSEPVAQPTESSSSSVPG